MGNPKYPNMELIEYKFRQALSQDAKWMKKFNKLKEKNIYMSPNFSVIVFPQTWGSTCTGFDVCSDGSPAIGGSAMTTEYTTVIEEHHTQTFAVFIGNRPCYMVMNATDEFFLDMTARNMASLSVAKERY